MNENPYILSKNVESTDFIMALIINFLLITRRMIVHLFASSSTNLAKEDPISADSSMIPSMH